MYGNKNSTRMIATAMVLNQDTVSAKSSRLLWAS